MPAVTVIPLRGTGIGAPHQTSGAGLLGVMGNPDGMPESEQLQDPHEGGKDPKKTSNEEGVHKQSSKGEDDTGKQSDMEKKDSSSTGGTVSPSQSSSSYQQGMPSNLTPQQPGYYVAYQAQVSPEPPSPAGHVTTIGYDVGSFLQQPVGISSFSVPQYPGSQVHGLRQAPGQAPPSPSQNSIPPPSPLFPRMTSGILDGATGQPAAGSVSPQYISPALGPSGVMYPSMSSYAAGSDKGSEDLSGWGDRNQVSPYPQNSPQISAQGIPIPYVPGMPRSASAAGRSYSFGDDSMLPPPAECAQPDQYSVSQGSPVPAPGALFGHQQAWGYAGPPPEMYGASASPMQPRPTLHYSMVGPPRHAMPPMGPYGGQFYPASSPGPPIQTTASNKGPDGANLFIFHIPNHFTNLDMYQLFCPYGNLLSVRIMVEKDTGRSRGFGFVSYDNPDSAALAIKELNGFAIGNKRLKVQHKQIRPSDPSHDRSHYHGADGRNAATQNLPPSGAMAWYSQQSGAMSDELGMADGEGNAYHSGSHESQEHADPLSGLEPLRQALPESGNEN